MPIVFNWPHNKTERPRILRSHQRTIGTQVNHRKRREQIAMAGLTKAGPEHWALMAMPKPPPRAHAHQNLLPEQGEPAGGKDGCRPGLGKKWRKRDYKQSLEPPIVSFQVPQRIIKREKHPYVLDPDGVGVCVPPFPNTMMLQSGGVRTLFRD
jgi:hypothetical protein